MDDLKEKLEAQRFANEFDLVNGVSMNAENPENFLIPPEVIRRHVRAEQFVELRIDSPRFSVHEDAPQKCACPACNGEMSKPILRHEHPATLVPPPEEDIPARGWGEDFWVRVTCRVGDILCGTVDNPLAEHRLHGLSLGDEVLFHQEHILAVHPIHRAELVTGMQAADLKELALWLSKERDPQSD